MPIERARRHVLPCEVVVLETGTIAHARDPLPLGTSPNIHPVLMAVVALWRKISIGVAVHAARVMKNLRHGFKGSSGSGIITRSRSVNVLDFRVFITGPETSHYKIGNQTTRDNRDVQDYGTFPP